MDLSRLPLVAIEEIERFVQPWRTYKKEEADLITWHCMWLEYEIRDGLVDGLVRLDRLGSAPEDGQDYMDRLGDDLGHQVHLGDELGREIHFGDSLVRLSRLVSVGHKVRLGDGYRYARRLGAQNSS